MNKGTVPKPPSENSVSEKLDFYNNLIENGLDIEGLKAVKRRLQFIDTYFEDTQTIIKKEVMLKCIEEMLEEE